MSRVQFLDLRRHLDPIRPEVDAAIAAVADRGWFVGGPSLSAFEHEFAEYCGVDHAVGVNSGTDALELALRAVGAGPGAEVITAASTCIPTIAAIESAGAVPVLADVDPATRTLDPDAAARAVTERTRAIVPVHLYGQCARMQPLLELARARGLAVVEDAAQAHGAEYRGARAGAMGDAAAFSFYPTKNLGALGDAGAVVTRDPELAERVRMLRSYGERSRYESVDHGRNSRLDELQAEVLRVKLRRLDAWNERRREIAKLYLEGLESTGLGLPVEADGCRHVYHLFCVETPSRERLRQGLEAEGVETLVHYPRAVHEHPAYRSLGVDANLSVSERLASEVVSLPLYPELSGAEVSMVVEAAKRVADRL